MATEESFAPAVHLTPENGDDLDDPHILSKLKFQIKNKYFLSRDISADLRWS